MIYEERDSRYWRARAAEARAKADQMQDPTAKATMNRVAEGYEYLAAVAAKREAESGRTSKEDTTGS